MKQYIGIVRDHSGSMQSLAKTAMADYNAQLAVLRDGAKKHKLTTLVSTVICGWSAQEPVKRETVNTPISKVQDIKQYVCPGMTPLRDSVGELIDIMENMPDAKDKDVAFLVLVITDGMENASKQWDTKKLSEKIKKLQGTDKWTFTFRVPQGHTRYITDLGVHAGNVVEWEQTAEGLRKVSDWTAGATQSYMALRASGVTSTKGFYTADLSGVTGQDVRQSMNSVTDKVRFFAVPTKKDGVDIQGFVESKLRRPMVKGAAFYQLTKPEKAVQSHKKIVIRNKKSGAVYAGAEARQLLGLPTTVDVKLAPGDHGGFDIFVQSMSTNRKLVGGTEVLYSEFLA